MFIASDYIVFNKPIIVSLNQYKTLPLLHSLIFFYTLQAPNFTVQQNQNSQSMTIDFNQSIQLFDL